MSDAYPRLLTYVLQLADTAGVRVSLVEHGALEIDGGDRGKLRAQLTPDDARTLAAALEGWAGRQA